MPDENKDLNKGQSVADTDLKDADVVDQQGLTDQVAEGQKQDDKLADGTNKDKTVKYEDMKKATDRAVAAEEKAAYAERTLELYQANVAGQQQGQLDSQAKPVGSTFEQALNDLGLTADDYFGENIVKVQNRKFQLDTAMQQQQIATTANMQFISSHSDFAQVVGSVNPATGQVISWSQEALVLVQEQPWLANASADGMYQAIMNKRKLVKFEENAAVNKEHLNRQDADNASQPLGGSAAGGGGAGDPNSQQMMTREQQQDIRDRVANGEEIP